MADQIIEMYSMGTSTRDISSYFEREFNTTLSADTISSITDRVLPEITAWYGEVTLEAPRDRDGTFQPETVK